MTRLDQLRELRANIDREIKVEVRAQRRVGRLETIAVEVWRNPDDTAAEILRTAAEMYHTTRAAIVGKTRTRRVVEARMAAACAIRTATGMSYPEIGRLLDRDHTTVMYAERRVKGDPKLAAAAAQLVRGVTGGAA